MKNRGLGRGLDALFSQNAGDNLTVAELRIADIEPNRGQPRTVFDEEALAELSESIKIQGVIQPIVVRPLAGGGYQIVAGERRWRAARLAGLETVPAVIRELTDEQTMEMALIENLQRQDLNPMEEALGYKSLIERCRLTQEDVAARVGKSRVAVTNALRLLQLPEEVQALLGQGKISAGHGRALLMFEDSQDRRQAAEKAAGGCSVRELERLAKSRKADVENGKPAPQAPPRDTFIREMELAMITELGRRVMIRGSEIRGIIEIEYTGRDDLTALANKLTT
ncbi:MAG: ParB/RepB/Spo0J family partition protein [Oscillospiraceae bacterium]|jgi:ParB family chromosome partitioning protein|nr:ParB/RepB/Spo0J family partition protein [Oscillospiraceae bacterium]